MSKIKTQISDNGRTTTIKILKGKEIVATETYTLNTCNYCRSEILCHEDLGLDYICPKCTEYLTNRFGKNTNKPEKSNRGIKKGSVVVNRTKTAVKEYHTDIKLVNYQQYKDLMEHIGLNTIVEKFATILVDLIIKGCNTVNRIYNALRGHYKIETLYKYLYTMVKVGMLYCPDMTNPVTKYDKIYKVNKTLLYTSVENNIVEV